MLDLRRRQFLTLLGAAATGKGSVFTVRLPGGGNI